MTEREDMNTPVVDFADAIPIMQLMQLPINFTPGPEHIVLTAPPELAEAIGVAPIPSDPSPGQEAQPNPPECLSPGAVEDHFRDREQPVERAQTDDDEDGVGFRIEEITAHTFRKFKKTGDTKIVKFLCSGEGIDKYFEPQDIPESKKGLLIEYLKKMRVSHKQKLQNLLLGSKYLKNLMKDN